MVSAVPPAVSDATSPQAPSGCPLRRYFGNIRRTVLSIFDGLAVTMSWVFRRPLTIQYPDKLEKPIEEMLPEAYRGLLELDVERCNACLSCQKVCPIGCIRIEVCKHPTTNAREMTRFDIDMGLCMYCSLCAEACNFDALTHTREFEATVQRPEDLMLHFVKQPRELPKGKRELPPKKTPGSILATMIPSLGRRAQADKVARYRQQTPPPAEAATDALPSIAEDKPS